MKKAKLVVSAALEPKPKVCARIMKLHLGELYKNSKDIAGDQAAAWRTVFTFCYKLGMPLYQNTNGLEDVAIFIQGLKDRRVHDHVGV